MVYYLYRVSQRMMKYVSSTEEMSIIKLLLENCIKLLKYDRNSRVSYCSIINNNNNNIGINLLIDCDVIVLYIG